MGRGGIGMDVNGVIGWRGGCQCRRRNWTAAALIGQQWHERSMDGGGVSGDNGRRQKDTTINQMHGQKADNQNETGRRTMVVCDDG